MGSGKAKKLVKKGKKKPFNKSKKKKMPVAKTTYVAIEEQPPLPMPGIPKSRGRPTVDRGGEHRGIRGRASTRGTKTPRSGMSSEDAIAAESESEAQARAALAAPIEHLQTPTRIPDTRATSRSPRPPSSPPPPKSPPPPPPRPESPDRPRKGPSTPLRMKSPPPPPPQPPPPPGSPPLPRTKPTPKKSVQHPTERSSPTEVSVTVKKGRMPNIHLVVGEREGNAAVPLEQHIGGSIEIEDQSRADRQA